MSRSLFSSFHVPVKRGLLPPGIVVSWKSPSNIALVKYWGKKGLQIPLNPSLSMTLTIACTTTKIRASLNGDPGKIRSVNGDPGHPFLTKMETLLTWISGEIPVLGQYSYDIETANSFPHSAGIASSASGMSAFSLCLLSMASRALPTEMSQDDFHMLASFVARMGSGSACRSVYGGFVLWGETDQNPRSSDCYAVPVTHRVHPSLLSLRDAILVISSTPKAISSTEGHKRMNNHPELKTRITEAGNNLAETLLAIGSGDLDRLAGVAENEALSLHAWIRKTSGGISLAEKNSHVAMDHIRAARKKGIPVFFTLDAGPNVHLLYPETADNAVEQLLREELIPLCEQETVIRDRCGSGPVMQEIELV
jgi:diphosphomevalonate decarboxylase